MDTGPPNSSPTTSSGEDSTTEILPNTNRYQRQRVRKRRATEIEDPVKKTRNWLETFDTAGGASDSSGQMSTVTPESSASCSIEAAPANFLMLAPTNAGVNASRWQGKVRAAVGASESSGQMSTLTHESTNAGVNASRWQGKVRAAVGASESSGQMSTLTHESSASCSIDAAPANFLMLAPTNAGVNASRGQGSPKESSSYSFEDDEMSDESEDDEMDTGSSAGEDSTTEILRYQRQRVRKRRATEIEDPVERTRNWLETFDTAVGESDSTHKSSASCSFEAGRANFLMLAPTNAGMNASRWQGKVRAAVGASKSSGQMSTLTHESSASCSIEAGRANFLMLAPTNAGVNASRWQGSPKESSPYSSEDDEMYDVFLSFRSEDTRKTFTDHLYWTLKDSRLDVYIGENNKDEASSLPDDVKRAIELSKVAVVVLSRRFSESRSCVEELDKMIECRNTRGLVLLPIFYQVEPSDLKSWGWWETKTFDLVFRKNEGYEGLFIRKVVDEINRNLKTVHLQ